MSDQQDYLAEFFFTKIAPFSLICCFCRFCGPSLFTYFSVSARASVLRTNQSLSNEKVNSDWLIPIKSKQNFWSFFLENSLIVCFCFCHGYGFFQNFEQFLFLNLLTKKKTKGHSVIMTSRIRQLHPPLLKSLKTLCLHFCGGRRETQLPANKCWQEVGHDKEKNVCKKTPDPDCFHQFYCIILGFHCRHQSEKRIRQLPEIDGLSKDTVVTSWMAKYDALMKGEKAKKKKKRP